MTMGIGLGIRLFAAKIHTERAVTRFQLPATVSTPLAGTPVGGSETARTASSGFGSQPTTEIGPGVFTPQSGGTKKRAKKYVMIVNEASTFEPICRLIYEQHGEDWLSSGLRQCFWHMFKNRTNYITQIHSFALLDAEAYAAFKAEKGLAADGEGLPTPIPPQLVVAGELGYTVGGCYTSLTGAYAADGSGAVQLNAMGLLLEQLGYNLWDLGMQMEYKADILNTTTWPRKKWLGYMADTAQQTPPKICALERLPASLGVFRCDEVTYRCVGEGGVASEAGASPLSAASPLSVGGSEVTPTTVTVQGTSAEGVPSPTEGLPKSKNQEKRERRKAEKERLKAQGQGTERQGATESSKNPAVEGGATTEEPGPGPGPGREQKKEQAASSSDGRGTKQSPADPSKQGTPSTPQRPLPQYSSYSNKLMAWVQQRQLQKP